MNLRELLLGGVAAWSALGLLGVTASLLRRERAKALRGLAWIAGIDGLYLVVLLGVSMAQPQQVVAMGQEQCFSQMCFTVTRVEEIPGFLIRDGSRLLRISVRVRNSAHDAARSDRLIRAYLIDAQGRRWEQSPALSGVRLTTRVAAAEAVISEPVFKVASDATGLELVFTRGPLQPGALVIGDSDSWLHRRAVVRLGR
jgi:hypothetical protein